MDELAAKLEMDASSLSRVAVLRALYLGDLLCAVPALRALRAALPRAEIVLIGLPWASAFADRYHKYIDRFLIFPGFPGLPEQSIDSQKIVSFFAQAGRERFDLALQMHGSGSHVNNATVLLGARQNAGYFLPGEYCPDPRYFLPYPVHEPEVWRHLRLMEFLGIPLRGDDLDFPVTEDDRDRLAALREMRDLKPGQYICIHPGAKFPSRRWPATRFAEVARSLLRDGWHIALTGVASERNVVAEVSDAIGVPHVNLVGLTDLGMLAALVESARLVITNDTGMSHIAAAVRTPSVVVILGSDERRWSPGDRCRHRVLSESIACRPCEHEVCPIGFPCAEKVAPARVLSAARELIDEYPAIGPAPEERELVPYREPIFDRAG